MRLQEGVRWLCVEDLLVEASYSKVTPLHLFGWTGVGGNAAKPKLTKIAHDKVQAQWGKLIDPAGNVSPAPVGQVGKQYKSPQDLLPVTGRVVVDPDAPADIAASMEKILGIFDELGDDFTQQQRDQYLVNAIASQGPKGLDLVKQGLSGKGAKARGLLVKLYGEDWEGYFKGLVAKGMKPKNVPTVGQFTPKSGKPAVAGVAGALSGTAGQAAATQAQKAEEPMSVAQSAADIRAKSAASMGEVKGAIEEFAPDLIEPQAFRKFVRKAVALSGPFAYSDRVDERAMRPDFRDAYQQVFGAPSTTDGAKVVYYAGAVLSAVSLGVDFTAPKPSASEIDKVIRRVSGAATGVSYDMRKILHVSPTLLTWAYWTAWGMGNGSKSKKEALFKKFCLSFGAELVTHFEGDMGRAPLEGPIPGSAVAGAGEYGGTFRAISQANVATADLSFLGKIGNVLAGNDYDAMTPEELDAAASVYFTQAQKQDMGSNTAANQQMAREYYTGLAMALIQGACPVSVLLMQDDQLGKVPDGVGFREAWGLTNLESLLLLGAFGNPAIRAQVHAQIGDKLALILGNYAPATLRDTSTVPSDAVADPAAETEGAEARADAEAASATVPVNKVYNLSTALVPGSVAYYAGTLPLAGTLPNDLAAMLMSAGSLTDLGFAKLLDMSEVQWGEVIQKYAHGGPYMPPTSAQDKHLVFYGAIALLGLAAVITGLGLKGVAPATVQAAAEQVFASHVRVPEDLGMDQAQALQLFMSVYGELEAMGYTGLSDAYVEKAIRGMRTAQIVPLAGGSPAAVSLAEQEDAVVEALREMIAEEPDGPVKVSAQAEIRAGNVEMAEDALQPIYVQDSQDVDKGVKKVLNQFKQNLPPSLLQILESVQIKKGEGVSAENPPLTAVKETLNTILKTQGTDEFAVMEFLGAVGYSGDTNTASIQLTGDQLLRAGKLLQNALVAGIAAIASHSTVTEYDDSDEEVIDLASGAANSDAFRATAEFFGVGVGSLESMGRIAASFLNPFNSQTMSWASSFAPLLRAAANSGPKIEAALKAAPPAPSLGVSAVVEGQTVVLGPTSPAKAYYAVGAQILGKPDFLWTVMDGADPELTVQGYLAALAEDEEQHAPLDALMGSLHTRAVGDKAVGKLFQGALPGSAVFGVAGLKQDKFGYKMGVAAALFSFGRSLQFLAAAVNPAVRCQALFGHPLTAQVTDAECAALWAAANAEHLVEARYPEVPASAWPEIVRIFCRGIGSGNVTLADQVRIYELMHSAQGGVAAEKLDAQPIPAADSPKQQAAAVAASASQTTGEKATLAFVEAFAAVPPVLKKPKGHRMLVELAAIRARDHGYSVPALVKAKGSNPLSLDVKAYTPEQIAAGTQAIVNAIQVFDTITAWASSLAASVPGLADKLGAAAKQGALDVQVLAILADPKAQTAELYAALGQPSSDVLMKAISEWAGWITGGDTYGQQWPAAAAGILKSPVVAALKSGALSVTSPGELVQAAAVAQVGQVPVVPVPGAPVEATTPPAPSIGQGAVVDFESAVPLAAAPKDKAFATTGFLPKVVADLVRQIDKHYGGSVEAIPLADMDKIVAAMQASAGSHVTADQIRRWYGIATMLMRVHQRMDTSKTAEVRYPLDVTDGSQHFANLPQFIGGINGVLAKGYVENPALALAHGIPSEPEVLGAFLYSVFQLLYASTDAARMQVWVRLLQATPEPSAKPGAWHGLIEGAGAGIQAWFAENPYAVPVYLSEILLAFLNLGGMVPLLKKPMNKAAAEEWAKLYSQQMVGAFGGDSEELVQPPDAFAHYAQAALVCDSVLQAITAGKNGPKGADAWAKFQPEWEAAVLDSVGGIIAAASKASAVAKEMLPDVDRWGAGEVRVYKQVLRGFLAYLGKFGVYGVSAWGGKLMDAAGAIFKGPNAPMFLGQADPQLSVAVDSYEAEAATTEAWEGAIPPTALMKAKLPVWLAEWHQHGGAFLGPYLPSPSADDIQGMESAASAVLDTLFSTLRADVSVGALAGLSPDVFAFSLWVTADLLIKIYATLFDYIRKFGAIPMTYNPGAKSWAAGNQSPEYQTLYGGLQQAVMKGLGASASVGQAQALVQSAINLYSAKATTALVMPVVRLVAGVLAGSMDSPQAPFYNEAGVSDVLEGADLDTSPTQGVAAISAVMPAEAVEIFKLLAPGLTGGGVGSTPATQLVMAASDPTLATACSAALGPNWQAKGAAAIAWRAVVSALYTSPGNQSAAYSALEEALVTSGMISPVMNVSYLLMLVEDIFEVSSQNPEDVQELYAKFTNLIVSLKPVGGGIPASPPPLDPVTNTIQPPAPVQMAAASTVVQAAPGVGGSPVLTATLSVPKDSTILAENTPGAALARGLVFTVSKLNKKFRLYRWIMYKNTVKALKSSPSVGRYVLTQGILEQVAPGGFNLKTGGLMGGMASQTTDAFYAALSAISSAYSTDPSVMLTGTLGVMLATDLGATCKLLESLKGFVSDDIILKLRKKRFKLIAAVYGIKTSLVTSLYTKHAVKDLSNVWPEPSIKYLMDCINKFRLALDSGPPLFGIVSPNPAALMIAVDQFIEAKAAAGKAALPQGVSVEALQQIIVDQSEQLTSTDMLKKLGAEGLSTAPQDYEIEVQGKAPSDKPSVWSPEWQAQYNAGVLAFLSGIDPSKVPQSSPPIVAAHPSPAAPVGGYVPSKIPPMDKLQSVAQGAAIMPYLVGTGTQANKPPQGSSGKEVFVSDDDPNQFYLFKPMKPQEAAAEVAAANIGALFLPAERQIPVVRVTLPSGEVGTMQPIPKTTQGSLLGERPGQGTNAKYRLDDVNIYALSPESITGLLLDAVHNFAVGNDKAQYSDLISLSDGTVIGTDKAAIPQFDSALVSMVVPKDRQVSAFNAFLGAIFYRTDSPEVKDLLKKTDFQVIFDAIEKIESIPDDVWLSAFTPYLKTLSGSAYTNGMNAILARKNTLREEFLSAINWTLSSAGEGKFEPRIGASSLPALTDDPGTEPWMDAAAVWPSGIVDGTQDVMQALAEGAYFPPVNPQSLMPVPSNEWPPSLQKGAGQREVYRDAAGNWWLWKPAIDKGSGKPSEQRAAVAELHSLVAMQARGSHIPAKAVVAVINGKETAGLLQPVISVESPATLQGIPPTSLSAIEREDVAAEHVLDWMMSSHDSHKDNFIRAKDPHGDTRVFGVDKEQSFKYFFDPDERLDLTYAPNAKYGESEPYYNKFWRDFRDGKLPGFDPRSMLATIQGIEAIPNAEYEAGLRKYAQASFKGDPAKQEWFVQKAIARKVTIRVTFEDFITKLMREQKAPEMGTFTFDSGWVKSAGAAPPSARTSGGPPQVLTVTAKGTPAGLVAEALAHVLGVKDAPYAEVVANVTGEGATGVVAMEAVAFKDGVVGVATAVYAPPLSVLHKSAAELDAAIEQVQTGVAAYLMDRGYDIVQGAGSISLDLEYWPPFKVSASQKLALQVSVTAGNIRAVVYFAAKPDSNGVLASKAITAPSAQAAVGIQGPSPLDIPSYYDPDKPIKYLPALFTPPPFDPQAASINKLAQLTPSTPMGEDPITLAADGVFLKGQRARVTRLQRKDGTRLVVVSFQIPPKVVYQTKYLREFMFLLSKDRSPDNPLKESGDGIPKGAFDSAAGAIVESLTTDARRYSANHGMWTMQTPSGLAVGRAYLGGNALTAPSYVIQTAIDGPSTKNAETLKLLPKGIDETGSLSFWSIQTNTHAAQDAYNGPAGKFDVDLEQFGYGDKAVFGLLRFEIPEGPGQNVMGVVKNLLAMLGPVKADKLGRNLAEILLAPPAPVDLENAKKAALLRAYIPKAIFDTIPLDKLQDGAFLDSSLAAAGISPNKLQQVVMTSPAPGHTTFELRGRWRNMVASKATKWTGVYFLCWSFSPFSDDGKLDFSRVFSLLRTGAKCAHARIEQGFGVSGTSVDTDLMSGGAGVCTMRVAGSHNSKAYTNGSAPSGSGHQGGVGSGAAFTYIISPTILDRLDLLFFHSDSYGNQTPASTNYAEHRSLEKALELVVQPSKEYMCGPEITVPWGVASEYIIGININPNGSYPPADMYKKMLEACIAAGILNVNGVPITSFITQETYAIDVYKKRVAPAMGQAAYISPAKQGMK